MPSEAEKQRVKYSLRSWRGETAMAITCSREEQEAWMTDHEECVEWEEVILNGSKEATVSKMVRISPLFVCGWVRGVCESAK